MAVQTRLLAVFAVVALRNSHLHRRRVFTRRSPLSQASSSSHTQTIPPHHHTTTFIMHKQPQSPPHLTFQALEIILTTSGSMHKTATVTIMRKQAHRQPHKAATSNHTCNYVPSTTSQMPFEPTMVVRFYHPTRRRRRASAHWQNQPGNYLRRGAKFAPLHVRNQVLGKLFHHQYFNNSERTDAS